MVDSRFFQNHGPFTAEQISVVTGTRLPEGGDVTKSFSDVAPLDRAGPTDVSFFDNVKYLDQFSHSKAGLCFVRPKYANAAPAGMTLLITEDPYRCYALTAQRFYPAHAPADGVAPTAIIAPSATLGKDVMVGPGAVISANVTLGDRCAIGANAFIGPGVTIGEDTSIGPISSLTHCLVGKRTIIHRGVHIGQDGFGFALGRDGHVKVPQLGRVIVGDDVEIGSGTTIDRGTGPDTVIGDGTKIDNLVQIGHNVQVGRRCVIVGQSGISGSTRFGDGVVLAGQAGVAGHLKIGHGVKIAAKSGVMTDIPAGASYGGFPAVPAIEWHRQSIAIQRLARVKRGTHE